MFRPAETLAGPDGPPLILQCAFFQLTGKRDSMIKWWTLVAFLLPAHTPLEFQ